ncbi:MAG TPA: host attachment protein [Caulobacteraceae bacterium]|jgi:protein required for attachment to host cells|nr:host attachment protein [Caulobacteraceae bacterium]
MHREPSLAYLVADAARARLLLRHGDGRYEVRASFDNEPFRRPRHDTRGRAFAPTGSARSAIGGRDRDREKMRSTFAGEVAAGVERSLAGAGVERLALVAPPRMLAALRSRLGPETARRVVVELARDLTKLPEAALRETLADLVLLRDLQA